MTEEVIEKEPIVYSLSAFSDPILYTPTKEFDFSNPPVDPKELSENLKATLVKTGGLGLSSNQVGLPYRVFVIGNSADPSSIYAMFNPKVVFDGENDVMMEEGCLTFPGLHMKILRKARVRVRFANWEGKVRTQVFDGLSARIIQHEMSHLDGKSFFHGASRLKLDRAIKGAAKFGVQYTYADLFKYA
jgi:peptide deformylase